MSIIGAFETRPLNTAAQIVTWLKEASPHRRFTYLTVSFTIISQAVIWRRNDTLGTRVQIGYYAAPVVQTSLEYVIYLDAYEYIEFADEVGFTSSLATTLSGLLTPDAMLASVFEPHGFVPPSNQLGSDLTSLARQLDTVLNSYNVTRYILLNARVKPTEDVTYSIVNDTLNQAVTGKYWTVGPLPGTYNRVLTQMWLVPPGWRFVPVSLTDFTTVWMRSGQNPPNGFGPGVMTGVF